MSLIKRYFRRFVLNNFGWKFMSLLLSVIIWLYCMNVTGSVVQSTKIVDIPLSIINDYDFAKNNMLLQNRSTLEKTNVQLQVSGNRADIDKLQSKIDDQGKFSAYINLGLMELRYAKDLGTPISTRIFVDSAPEFKVLKQDPETAVVILEKYEERSKEVTIYTEGKPAEDFVVLPLESAAEKVTIGGPQTLVLKVSEVSVTINIKNASDELVVEAEPKAYDYEGNEVTDITITPPVINVTLPIYKTADIPISPPEYKGNPPSGYEITGVDWNPKYVKVMGAKEDIAALRELTLWPVEIDDTYTQTKEVPFDIRTYLPTNILMYGTAQEISVTIYIEKIEQKNFSIKSDKISIKGGSNNIDFLSDSSEAIFSGIESLIKNVSETNIQAYIDLTGLEPGEHNVPLSFTLPDGISVVNSPTIQILINEI